MGLASGEVVSAADSASPSLMVSLGQAIIDRAPPAGKDTAIDLLGTADKPALVVLILVVALALGSAVGRLAASGRRTGPFLAGPILAGPILAGPILAGLAYAAGGIVLTWPALTRTPSGSAVVVAAGAATVVGGLASLWLFLSPPPAPAPAEEGVDAATGGRPIVGRRGALRVIGEISAVAVFAGGAGRFLARFTRSSIPEVTLPEPALGLNVPVSTSSFTDVEGLSPLFTPNGGFYRIDTALVLPRVDLDTWRLRVTGLVERPFELSFAELLALPQTEIDATLSCVSNEVGGKLVGTARWQGVLLADLLNRAGLRPDATQVVGRSVDGWTGGFPTELVFDGRPALVAVGMNGEPLPLAHGFPARLVVGGLYGYVSATKWLSEIELATLEGFDGYWVPRGWNKLGPVEIQSRIDVPRFGSSLPSGPQVIAGMAWAPPVGIEAVEVSVDGGPWEQAELSPELSPHVWRQWRYTLRAGEGRHQIVVRAIDHDGRRQIEERRRPRPGGATGMHEIMVWVG